MDQDRRTYKLVRLLTGGVTPAVLAVALLIFALRDGAWEPGAQAAGICRELLSGTTEGRQALFGSCWVAPLPVLFYLPFAWLFSEPLAGWTAFFAAWLFVFWAVRESMKATGQSGWRIVLAQIAIAAMMAAMRQPHALQISTALTMGLVLLAAAGLADWTAYRRLRDLVAAGASGAFLMLCGFSVFGPAVLAVFLLPFAACGTRETRTRFQAWLLLGWLPLVYAVGVWLLVDRLILADSLFFLRSLGHLVPHVSLLLLALLTPALIFVPALAVIWRNEKKATAGSISSSVLLLAFAIALMSFAKVLNLFGIGWGTTALHVCLLAVMMIAVARLRQPIYQLVAALALFVWLSMFWFVHGQTPASSEKSRDEVCQQVESYVNERTPYGRVFVVGYAGLDLLRNYTGERLVPNMDLHVGSLRQAYKGQNLYVLVPEPVGAVRAENVFWRFPDIYELGCDRLLFAEEFGDWRLFEVITAPTQEQLDEWKKAR